MNDECQSKQEYENQKVFVGNMPMETSRDEVADFLIKSVEIEIKICTISLLVNKNSQSNVQTMSAIVSLDSPFQSKFLVKNHRNKYGEARCDFKNKAGKTSKIYVSPCYKKPEHRDVPGKTKTIVTVNYLKEPETYIDCKGFDKSALVRKIGSMENRLKEKCPELHISSKELALLQKEFDELTQTLDAKKKELLAKQSEFVDVYEIFEQLNG